MFFTQSDLQNYVRQRQGFAQRIRRGSAQQRHPRIKVTYICAYSISLAAATVHVRWLIDFLRPLVCQIMQLASMLKDSFEGNKEDRT